MWNSTYPLLGATFGSNEILTSSPLKKSYPVAIFL